MLHLHLCFCFRETKMESSTAFTTNMMLNSSDQYDSHSCTTDNSLNMTSHITGSSSKDQDLLYVIPGPVICAFGIFCNVLNLLVLSHKSLNESPYVYLTALSVSDLTLLLVSFFVLTAFNLTGTMFKAIFDLYVFFYFGNVCFNCSVWIIVSMTIERAYFVHRPLRVKMSRWKTRIRIFVIFIVCLILNIPRLFCFEIRSMPGNKFILNGTDFRKSLAFFKVSWVHAVIINFIPVLILTITNSTLIFALRKAQKARVTLTGGQNRNQEHDQVRMTRTLVAIVILFFICVVPSAFVDYPIAYSLFGKGKKWDEYLRSPANLTLIYISNLLLFLNSSLNFILYCVFNRKFRKAMKDILQRMRPRRQMDHSYNFQSAKTSTTQL